MKFQLLCFAILLIFAACNPSQPTQNQTTDVVEPTEEQPDPAPPAAVPTPAPAVLPATDMFVGEFVAVDYDEKKNISYSNKITVAFQSLENGLLKGYSVVAGNSRPFEGTYKEKDGTLDATVREPATTNTTAFLPSNGSATAQSLQAPGKPTTPN